MFGNSNLFGTIERLRQGGAITVDSGDFFEGSPEYEFFGGALETAVLAECYDVIAPGNHAFETYENLAKRGSKPLIISTNLHGWHGPAFHYVPASKLLIGAILGEQAYATVDRAKRVYRLLSPYDTLIGLISHARELDADLILLSHQGYAADCRLIENVRDPKPLKAILSGHCHSPATVSVINDVVIAVAPADGAGFAVLRLEHEAANCEVVTRDDLPRNTDAELRSPDVIATYHARMAKNFSRLPVYQIQMFRSDAGDAASILLRVAKHLAVAQEAAVILNSHCIRGNLLQDYPYFDDLSLMRIFPFDNKLFAVELTEPAGSIEKQLLSLSEPCVGLNTNGRAAHTVVTTDYITMRLRDEGKVQSVRPLQLTLRQAAIRALCTSELP